MFGEPGHVVLVEHDVEVVQVARQAPHLDVVALADDDHVIAVAHERVDRAMGHVHERACGLDNGETARAGAASARFDAPWAVTISVGVVTAAASPATAMPLARRSARTVGCARGRRGW